MLDKTKTNKELGLQVHKYLEEKGVETPIYIHNDLDALSKINMIESMFIEIMKTLNLDLKDDSLIETPKRVAKMYVNEIFWGLDYANFPKITTVENKMQYDEMIIEKDIKVSSQCEHHLVTIDGFAHIAYIPKETVIGLSKMNRIVEFFSKRPQIQERLTEQIFYALSYLLNTEDIAVTVHAKHFCVISRGVEDVNSSTVTSKVGGAFKSVPSLKQEYLTLIRS
jgi:GTP cyclohydrolase I